MAAIWVFNTFARVWLLTKGGPGNATDVLVTYAYKAGLGGFQLGYGAAITLVFAPVFLLAVIYLTPHLIEEQEK